MEWSDEIITELIKSEEEEVAGNLLNESGDMFADSNENSIVELSDDEGEEKNEAVPSAVYTYHCTMCTFENENETCPTSKNHGINPEMLCNLDNVVRWHKTILFQY